jgi:hypothetical protein
VSDDQGFLGEVSDNLEYNTGFDIGDLASMAQRQQMLREQRRSQQTQSEIASLLRKQDAERNRVAALPECPFCRSKNELGAVKCRQCHSAIGFVPDTLVSDSAFVSPSEVGGVLEGVRAGLLVLHDEGFGRLLSDFERLARSRNALQIITQAYGENPALSTSPVPKELGCGTTAAAVIATAAIGFAAFAADTQFQYTGVIIGAMLAALLAVWGVCQVGQGMLVVANAREAKAARSLLAEVEARIAAVFGRDSDPIAIARLVQESLPLLRTHMEKLTRCESDISLIGQMLPGRDVGVNPCCSVASWPAVPRSPFVLGAGDTGITDWSSIISYIDGVCLAHYRNKSGESPAFARVSISTVDVWVRLPNGKVGGPYGMDTVQANVKDGRYPSGTQWSNSEAGPWEFLVRPKGAEQKTDHLWVRTPEGKRGGPYTKDQISKAIAAGKLPEGSEAASSPDGPWRKISGKRG